MLEIFIVYRLSKGIGDIAQGKGRMRFGYQLLLWLFWFGGEIFGAILGSALSAAGGAAEPYLVLVYGFGIGGAIIGAVIAFAIVNSLPSLKTDDDFYRGPNRRTADRLADSGGLGSWPPVGSEQSENIWR